MPRKKSRSLTDGEYRIMEVLWHRGRATVAEVVEALHGKDGTAYSTILTMMRIMAQKGYLACEKEGRAFVYTPKLGRDTAAQHAVSQLLSRFFAGSPRELVLSFLQNDELTPQELEELRRKILEAGGRE